MNPSDKDHVSRTLDLAKGKTGGTADLLSAISTAGDSLQFLKTKGLGQRIIVFVGSTLPASTCQGTGLDDLAKTLKGKGIHVDVIAFKDGAFDSQKNVLQTFVDNVSQNNSSYARLNDHLFRY